MLGLSVRPAVVLFLAVLGEVFSDDSSELPLPPRMPGEDFGTKAGADVEPSPLRDRRLLVSGALDICGRAVPILILDSETALFVERGERSVLFFSKPDLESAGFSLEDDDDCPEPKDRLGGCEAAVGILLPLGRGIALRLKSDLGVGKTL